MSAIMTPAELIYAVKQGRMFDLISDNLAGRSMTMEEFIVMLNYLSAYWQYPGEARAEVPHALLKAGGHSNGFIACMEILRYPGLCKLFANEIIKKIISFGEFEIGIVDVVVSSAYSAIGIGWEVASGIRPYNHKVEYITAEKDKNGNPTIIRGKIDSGKTVLVVNELMTTIDGSTWETKQAVRECNGEGKPPKIIDPSFVFVNRSNSSVLTDGSRVVGLFNFDMTDYDLKKETCPYCEKGSQAMRPKEGTNWKTYFMNS